MKRGWNVVKTAGPIIMAATAGLGNTAAALPADRAVVDILIVNGTLVDGTGAPGRRADVAINGDHIVAIGTPSVNAKTLIDARGEIVAPGFIDIHNHSDVQLVDPANRGNETYLVQGVTTIIGGPDGECSPRCMRERTRIFRSQGVGTNFGFYVGHNGIRTEVMGKSQKRAPTPAELKRMRALVREGMGLGAVGLSTGLMYEPGVYSRTSEVIALAREVKPYGGIYESHVRNPSHALLQSNAEAIAIGAAAGIPVDLTHLTAPGRYNHGLMGRAIRQIEAARKAGIDVVADQYPYTALVTATPFGLLNYPEDIDLSSRESIRKALASPPSRARIREATLAGSGIGPGVFHMMGTDAIQILSCPGCAQLNGKFLSELVSPTTPDEIDVIMQLILATHQDVAVTLGAEYEGDLQTLMRHPWVMVVSDGRIPETGSFFAGPHPRYTGTFPRVLGRYARDLKLLTLEDAVRRMTSAPADFLGLKDRGRIKVGAKADIAIFDPKQISDHGTWANPTAPPTGVRDVFVNGRQALADGKFTAVTAGEWVKRQMRTRPWTVP